MGQIYPFTDPVLANQEAPTAMVSGEGCYVTDASGKTYLDGVAGLWCTALGFSDERLIEAANKQMRTLPYYHSFMGRTASVSEELAKELGALLPDGVNRVFFGCNGSDAVETAAKIVRFYWNAKGQPTKKKIIAREGAYHGSLQTSAALTGMSYCHDGFDLPDARVLRTGRPFYHLDKLDGESEVEFSKRRATELEELILSEGAENIGAFIGEPVIGSGGVVPPAEGYWDAIQEVLRKYDILLVADEIITGFGRTGEWFASTKFGMKPDLMTMAKQLSSAYFPISAVGVSDRVIEGIEPYAHELGTFGHGLTYGGHPVGCAVALETLRIYKDDKMMDRVNILSEHLQALLKDVDTLGQVKHIRITGLMAGVDLATYEDARSVADDLERKGILLRVINNTLAISPPYIITEEELTKIANELKDSIQALLPA